MEDKNQAENINTEELQTDIQELFQAYIIDRIQELIAKSEANLKEQQKEISDEVKKLSLDAGIIQVLDKIRDANDNIPNTTANLISDTVNTEKADLIDSLTTIYLTVKNASEAAKEEHNTALQQHSNEFLLNRTLLLNANNTCATISSQIEALNTQLRETNADSQTANAALQGSLSKLCSSELFAATSKEITNIKDKLLPDLQKASSNAHTTITSEIEALKTKLREDYDAVQSAAAALQATIHTENGTSTARLEARIDTLQQQLSTRQNLLFRLLLISGLINTAGIIALIILLVS